MTCRLLKRVWLVSALLGRTLPTGHSFVGLRGTTSVLEASVPAHVVLLELRDSLLGWWRVADSKMTGLQDARRALTHIEFLFVLEKALGEVIPQRETS